MIRFRALTTTVGVTLDDDVRYPDLARALVSRYPSADASALHYHLGRNRLLRDDEELDVEDPDDVIPAFELDFYEQVVGRASPGWFLHAAAIEHRGRAFVICGASGAGKTTLALELARRGYKLLTDEMVRIDSAGVVQGLQRPFHMAQDSEHLTRVPASWQRLVYPFRDRTGTAQQGWLFVPPADAFGPAALPLGIVVRIGHAPDWPTTVRRLAARDALEHLWDRSFRQDDASLAAATAVAGRWEVLEATSSTPEGAWQNIDSTLNRL